MLYTANLDKDLAYIRVWIDKWPFTLADKEISAGIVVEPSNKILITACPAVSHDAVVLLGIELSDLVCSIQAVATYDFGKNVTYDYQFHWCKEHYTVPPHVNCPAHSIDIFIAALLHSLRVFLYRTSNVRPYIRCRADFRLFSFAYCKVASSSFRYPTNESIFYRKKDVLKQNLSAQLVTFLRALMSY